MSAFYFGSMTRSLVVAAVVAVQAFPAVADIETGLTALDAGDVATAALEFQQSFEAGDGDGAFYLGRLFEFGLGADVDMPRAANLYAAGAEAGSILAMNRLGLLYLEGATLLRDYPEAARLFCQAADLGDQNGQLNCALMLQEGRGVAADPARAVTYFEQAAAQGNIAAKNLLGQILITGNGVPQDTQAAISLFKETAEAGNAMGLFELAKSYASGNAPDFVQAYAYANLAAVRQHEEARILRDRLELEMDNELINAAQTLAKEWTAARIAEQATAQQN